MYELKTVSVSFSPWVPARLTLALNLTAPPVRFGRNGCSCLVSIRWNGFFFGFNSYFESNAPEDKAGVWITPLQTMDTALSAVSSEMEAAIVGPLQAVVAELDAFQVGYTQCRAALGECQRRYSKVKKHAATAPGCLGERTRSCCPCCVGSAATATYSIPGRNICAG